MDEKNICFQGFDTHFMLKLSKSLILALSPKCYTGPYIKDLLTSSAFSCLLKMISSLPISSTYILHFGKIVPTIHSSQKSRSHS